MEIQMLTPLILRVQTGECYPFSNLNLKKENMYIFITMYQTMSMWSGSVKNLHRFIYLNLCEFQLIIYTSDLKMCVFGFTLLSLM